MSKLFKLDHLCPKCGTGHLSVPCSYPCTCGCRKCGARLDCRGVREPTNAGALASPEQREARLSDKVEEL